MLLLTSASFPRYGLERFFQFAQEAGYQGVEISLNANFDTQDPSYLQSLQDKYQVQIKAFSLGTDHPESLLKPFQTTVREFPGTMLNLYPPEVFAFRYRQWLTGLIPKLCQKYSLHANRINGEFKLLFGLIPLQTQSSLAALRASGHVALDTSALWQRQQDLLQAQQFLGKRLRHVYLSNVLNDTTYSRPDQGILPLSEFLQRLHAKGYPHHITLKISPQQLQQGQEEQMRKILVESREFYETHFAAPTQK